MGITFSISPLPGAVVGTLLWLSARVYGTKSPINCICHSHDQMKRKAKKKKCLFLDHVYHVLYNYHVYWIFILTVTKEPSAHSSSPVELRHQLWNTGNDSSPQPAQVWENQSKPHFPPPFWIYFVFFLLFSIWPGVGKSHLNVCQVVLHHAAHVLMGWIFFTFLFFLLSSWYFNNRLARPQKHNPL